MYGRFSKRIPGKNLKNINKCGVISNEIYVRLSKRISGGISREIFEGNFWGPKGESLEEFSNNFPGNPLENFLKCSLEFFQNLEKIFWGNLWGNFSRFRFTVFWRNSERISRIFKRTSWSNFRLNSCSYFWINL